MNQASPARQTFGSNLDLERVRVPVDPGRELSSHQWDSFVQTFNRFGFAILDGCEAADQAGFGRYFGNSVPHVRSEADGRVAIRGDCPQAGMLDTTSGEHPLHTDGSFHEQPERIVTLFCERAAASGGMSMLASASGAYAWLADQFGSRVQALASATVFGVRRLHQAYLGPLLFPEKDGLGMRFRQDDGAVTLELASDICDLYLALCNFFEQTQNRVLFNLKAGQLLVLDNTSVVHGRTAFVGQENRLLWRLNFDGRHPLYQKHLRIGFPGALG